MKILETKRLILRTWRKQDLLPMLVINQDPNVMRYLPTLQNKQTTQGFIQRIQQHHDKYGYSLYAVELKSTGEVIGFVGLQTVAFKSYFTPAVEIGWRLASNHWNKGYATEASKTVLDYAFNTLYLDRIVSFASTNNMASRRIMEKICLKYKGNFDHPNLRKDHPLCRHVLYEKIRS